MTTENHEETAITCCACGRPARLRGELEQRLRDAEEREGMEKVRADENWKLVSQLEQQVAELSANEERLRNALELADKAMNHMGDKENAMDIVTDEDIAVCAPALEAVRHALATPRSEALAQLKRTSS